MTLPNQVALPFSIETITVPTNNYTKGRFMNPDLIVIHIAEGSKQAVINTFQNPAVEKSSHLLINKDGSVTQFVSTADTAYGNGIVVNPISEIVLSRPGKNPNGYSISIEHEGFADTDITTKQYAKTIKVLKFLHDKWNIPLDSTHIIRHREIEASKPCPGLINVEYLIQQARLL